MATRMLGVACAVGFLALAAPSSQAAAGAPSLPMRPALLSNAESDFAEVLVEVGRSGSAPLVGEARYVERSETAEAERDFEAVLGELGLSGSAPLVGVDGSHEARVEAASQACRDTKVSTIRLRATPSARR